MTGATLRPTAAFLAARPTILSRSGTPRPSFSLRPIVAASKGSPKKSLPILSQKHFFDREKEIAAVERKFDGLPTEILVFVGPKDTGKSELFDEIARRRAAAQSVAGEGPPPVLILDARATDVSTPLELSKYLKALVINDTGLQKWWKLAPESAKRIGVTLSLGGGAKVELKDFFQETEGKSPIGSTVDSLGTFLDAVRPLPKKPVFIIDEANVLMEWTEDDKGHSELKKLLRFFVRVTKQKQLAHIVLATSDYFLVSWLRNEGLSSGQFSVSVIGDLPTELEAKLFVEDLASSGLGLPLPTADDKGDMWHKVYDVCGGNIGLLQRCASTALAWGWETSVGIIRRGAAEEVGDAFHPELYTKYTRRAPPAWTAEHFKTVLREIAHSPFHAVVEDALAEKVGRGSRKWWNVLFNTKEVGRTVLMSMVEWNLVALRPYSELAEDLPAEVFGKKSNARVFTMPSRAHLCFVLEMDETGDLETMG